MTAPDDAPPLDAPVAAAVVAAQFRELRPVDAAFLGDGCDSSAFLINGRWLFRFPKRADVEQQLLVERRILPRLAAHAPVPIPEYRFFGQPSPAFPFHFGGYPKLPGTPAIRLAPSPSLARDIGRFLSWLHAVPPRDLADIAIPSLDPGGLIDEARADALGDFPLLDNVAPDAPLDEWYAYLTSPPTTRGPGEAVLLHNDFAAEHVLIDDAAQAVTGVIDWSDLALGDRSRDLAGILHWGGRPLLEAVRPHYHGALDDEGVARAMYLAACRGVMDVAFGVERARPEYVAAGLRAMAFAVRAQ